MAPISVTLTMLRRWPRCSGVSRASSTRRRRSLSTTSAARVSRLSARLCATAASVRMEQGAMTMPAHWNEPLAMLAPTLRASWATCASARTASGSMPSSWCSVRQPASDTTRCDSMPAQVCSTCSRRTPYTAPLAPEMPTTMRRSPGPAGGGAAAIMRPSAWIRAARRRRALPRLRRCLRPGQAGAPAGRPSPVQAHAVPAQGQSLHGGAF